jgi:uncharacterized membrane protein HdeD (DUF308 family)
VTSDANSTASDGAIGGREIQWGWLLALGVLITMLGVLGLGMTYWLTAVAVFWCGLLAIVGGAAQILDAFHHREWKGIVGHVITGLLYLMAGTFMIFAPVSSAFWLTLFLAVSLIVTGVIRVITAVRIRASGPAWLAVLLSGVISVALGILIYGMVTPPGPDALATPQGQAAWIRAWGWVIGMFVAFELITEGVALICIAVAARSTTTDRPVTAGNAPST